MSERVTIDGPTFKECLKLLGWSHSDAAEKLGVHSRKRVGDWASGRRPVPPYISKSIAREVDIALLRKGM
jgi:transcriptional regulator with XRE-family HTH domain